MSQAKTLTEKEMKKMLNYISTQKYAARDRAMFLLTHLSGMRVGEVAVLKIGDIWADGVIKHEVRLQANQTKGDFARTVFLAERLRKELIVYLAMIDRSDLSKPLFKTQKSVGFTANTLCQHFHYLYKNAGIDGASSHSGRRSFITNLAAKGVGVRVIMGLSGHKALSSVQCYIDCNDTMKRNAVELI